MNAETLLSTHISTIVNTLYGLQTKPADIVLQKTKKEIAGDFTLVVFPFVKASKQGPEQTAAQIGDALKAACAEVQSCEVLKGFLNITFTNAFWMEAFARMAQTADYGLKAPNSSGKTIMIEYSSPNTNKPLHLGHVRNNLLGYSVAELLKSQGHRVIKANLVNDRGIHICKSMLAWQKFGNGETPASSGMKGDHLVGKYYVEYDKWYKGEAREAERIAQGVFDKIKARNNSQPLSAEEEARIILVAIAGIVLFAGIAYLKLKQQQSQLEITGNIEDIIASGDAEKIRTLPETNQTQSLNIFDEITRQTANLKPDEFNKYKLSNDDRSNYEKLFEEIKSKLTPVREAQDMLRKWEAGDKDTLALWNMMNGWVYEGFAISYKNLGVDFDKMYYESNTYLLGKELVQEGLEKGVFYKKDNGSVAIDLSSEGLDEKIVLRSDGTSVYITQDLGTAIERFKEFPALTQLIYTVGNEQDYHFKVLFKILEKLGYDWAKECYHLSYGMVELPEGKMKSREGTVVDADDLMDEMVKAAAAVMEESDKLKEFSEAERAELYPMVGMGALKYFILKVDPKKKMLFDPKESISLIGNTGPFIQYTYARTRSILRDAVDKNLALKKDMALQSKELEIIRELYEFPATVTEAAKAYNPGAVANQLYELAKLYNQFYHDHPVLQETDTDIRQFRLMLCQALGDTLRTGMKLLGMQAPERM